MVRPQGIAIRNNDQLLVLDKNNVLWSGNLFKVKFVRKLSPLALFMSISRLGALLGKAQGLTTQTDESTENHYLYYYMPRDGAVVRWNFR